MRFEIWDTLFNILIFLFWFRIWHTPGRDGLYNPYVGGWERVSGGLTDFLAPVFLGTPIRIVALAAVLFLCLFRAVLFRNLAGSLSGDGWMLEFGLTKGLADPGRFVSFLGFSLISFGVFVFKLWGFSLLYVRTPDGQTSSNPEEMLHVISQPLTSLPRAWRPLIVLVLGMILLALVEGVGIAAPLNTWNIHPWPAAIGRLFISAFAAWVGILSLLLTMVMALIIGSWISMISSNMAFSTLVREWLDYLLNWFGRHRIQIGMIDLSPIVFFFAVQFIYVILMAILLKSYSSLQAGLSF